MSGYVPVRLAYEIIDPVSGDGDKSPIIFLHCCAASKEYWTDIPQTVANATKRKVYLLDARNHGDSEWTDEFSFDINSDDLVHFMDTMNIPKAILVGHSMGGLTAIRTALKKAERVEKLIVEDMTVRKLSKATLDMLAAQMTLVRQAEEQMPSNVDEAGAKKFILEYIYSYLPEEIKALKKGDTDTDDPYIIALKRKPDGRYGFKANLKVIDDALKKAETLMSEPNGIYDGPACFIYGKLSPFSVGADEQHIKQFFPCAEFEAIEGASHAVHTDCPREFTDSVLKFLSRS